MHAISNTWTQYLTSVEYVELGFDNSPYIKASLTSKRLYACAERAFIQQNRAAMLFLLFCFCQLFDLFGCHGQPRIIVSQIDESTKPP